MGLPHLLHLFLFFSPMHATLSLLTRFSSLISFLLCQPLKLRLWLFLKSLLLLLKSLHSLLLLQALSHFLLLKDLLHLLLPKDLLLLLLPKDLLLLLLPKDLLLLLLHLLLFLLLFHPPLQVSSTHRMSLVNSA